MKPILKCQDIHRSYGPIQAVKGLNLTLDQGLNYALLGPSGCGKTTLLRLLAGLDAPDRGKIILRNKVANNPKVRIPPEKRKLSMVFQNLALWPHMTVEKNLTFGLKDSSRKNRIEKANMRLEMMQLMHRRTAYPNELSQGERQRVALARALISNPDLLLLDEPLANLDLPLKKSLLSQISEIGKKEKVTILFVTHDCQEAMAIADKLLIMREGKIVQEGTPEEVYRHPFSPFAGFLIGNGGFVKGDIKNKQIVSNLGVFPLNNKTSYKEILLFFRPEDIQICTSNTGHKAMVVNGSYTGGRWLWEIEIAGDRLSLYASDPPPLGELIYIEVIHPPSQILQDME